MEQNTEPNTEIRKDNEPMEDEQEPIAIKTQESDHQDTSLPETTAINEPSHEPKHAKAEPQTTQSPSAKADALHSEPPHEESFKESEEPDVAMTDGFNYEQFHNELLSIIEEPCIPQPKQTETTHIQNEETEDESREQIEDSFTSESETFDTETIEETSEELPPQDESITDPVPVSTQSTRMNWWMHQGWDYGLSFLLFALSAFLTYRLYDLSLLSGWIWKIGVVLLIINLLFALTLLRKLPNWLIWLRRCIILLLCALLTYGTIFANTLQESLEAITKPETATTINVSLVTKRDGGAMQLAELSGKKIGIQTANDNENSSYVKQQLSKESDLKNVTYVEEIDYDSLYQQLMKEEIDALIITDYYFKTLLKEHYPTIEDDIFILKSYQKEKSVKQSSSNKDIRYETFTVYIAGVDEGDDPSIDARSDVNIVLIVNPLANHIKMVSIPRDSFVPNPALGYANDKLTHLGLNGVENSMEGLEEVLGFEIDYYVKLNFFSVIEIIDAIGEIEVEVPIAFCEQDENRSFADEDLICLNEGRQTLNGKQALAFARHRKSYTDVMRGKAQQEVIKGTINALTSTAGALNINNVLKIASKAVSTNMPMEQVTNFVSAQLDNLKPWTIESIILENGVDASLVTASMPSVELYVMLLNPIDIQAVYTAYQEMMNQMEFASFTFHLDHLEDRNAELPYNPNILWAGSDTGNYHLPDSEQAPDDTIDVPDETQPDQPETPSIPDSEPEQPDDNDPSTPTDPDQPTNPDQPTPDPEPNPDPSPDPNPGDGGSTPPNQGETN
ncbi:MAG: hypothetical protein HFE68_01410 [Erysipelotrichaceae bacterium]|nr:hypothetical protein [Erysipelotrichaceae bacterium]